MLARLIQKHYRSQPSQLEPSVGTVVEPDQLAPKENQGNPIQSEGSQNLALLFEDSNGIPWIPKVGENGDMNYGLDFPSVTEWIQNYYKKDLWRRSGWDPEKQTKPKCAFRKTVYGGPNMFLEMFPFCCEKEATYRQDSRFVGDEAQRRDSLRGRWLGCEECRFSSSYLPHEL